MPLAVGSQHSKEYDLCKAHFLNIASPGLDQFDVNV